jgi:hypothetical protein
MTCSITVSTQAVFSINIHILGGSDKQTGFVTSSDIAIAARVIWPTDWDANAGWACAIGETQVEAYVWSETKMLDRRVHLLETPLGRRCFNLKSMTDLAGAPEQPYCGDGIVQREGAAWVQHEGATYRSYCSFKLGPSGIIDELRNDIVTLQDCLGWCNSRSDCKFASWEFRDYPIKCRLYSEIDWTDVTQSWWNYFVEQTSPPPPPPPPPSIPPRPPATASRPPLRQTTLDPANLRPFTPPTGAPAPPLPANYPPRNPKGFCGGLKEGSHTVDVAPLDVEFDIECGTIIDYTDIALTSTENYLDFEMCMYTCRNMRTDCLAVMYTENWPQFWPRNCIILTSYNAQRYSTNDSIALAIKVREGTGVNWRR